MNEFYLKCMYVCKYYIQQSKINIYQVDLGITVGMDLGSNFYFLFPFANGLNF